MIKKRIAAHKPQAAQVDAHIRFALRHAINEQKRIIKDMEEFGETGEATRVKEYDRLTYFERLSRQTDLLRIEQ